MWIAFCRDITQTRPIYAQQIEQPAVNPPVGRDELVAVEDKLACKILCVYNSTIAKGGDLVNRLRSIKKSLLEPEKNW